MLAALLANLPEPVAVIPNISKAGGAGWVRDERVVGTLNLKYGDPDTDYSDEDLCLLLMRSKL